MSIAHIHRTTIFKKGHNHHQIEKQEKSGQQKSAQLIKLNIIAISNYVYQLTVMQKTWAQCPIGTKAIPRNISTDYAPKSPANELRAMGLSLFKTPTILVL
jgi:hypothetical protein